MDSYRSLGVGRLSTAAALAVCLGLSLGAQGLDLDVETVALTGDQAPGAADGDAFIFFRTPMLNASGQTTFFSVLAGAGVNGTNSSGIYSNGSGTLTQVARTGGQVPDADNGVVFSSFLGTPTLNASGQTAFRSFLTGTGVGGSNNQGIYRDVSGALTQVARTGDQAPDTAEDVVFSNFDNLVLNASGQTAFVSILAGEGVGFANNRAIYSNGSGALTLVARTGEQAPGDGAVFSLLGAPVLNASGQTAFQGTLVGEDVTLNNNMAIYSDRSGTLTQIVREGDQAPDTASGTVFSVLGAPVLNALGQIAFVTGLRGGGVNNIGIYSEGSGTLAQVVRTGEQAPDADSGVVFDSFLSPVLNASGQTAFEAILTGADVDFTNDRGIYSEGSGTLREVAREGGQAPGAASRVVLDSFLDTPVLNAAGQIAFTALLAGEGVNGANNTGLYATDLDGQLIEIIRTGDLFDVDDDPLVDDLRTVSLFSFIDATGNEDGQPSGFNDLGQLVFTASFTDGSSGVFISNLVAVPEPSSLALLAVAGLGLLRRRRA